MVQSTESSSRSRSQGTTLHSNFQRSLSPSGRFCSSSISTTSTSYVRNRPESFMTRPESFITRPSSPTRINVCRSVSPSPAVRISTSQRQSIASSRNRYENPTNRNRQFNSGPKKTCMCSPTTHPGSFRCSLHKNNNRSRGYNGDSHTSFQSSHHLNMRRSAMTNSLVYLWGRGHEANRTEADLLSCTLTGENPDKELLQNSFCLPIFSEELEAFVLTIYWLQLAQIKKKVNRGDCELCESIGTNF